MAKALYIFLIVLSIGSSSVFGQGRNLYKYELIGGMGPTNFLGELGGANKIGTHFLRDFDFNSTRFCMNAGIRYKNHPYFAFKGMLSFAMLSGNDALTTETYRHNRNLNFRSPILELSVQGEFYFLKERTKKTYAISGVTGGKKRKRNLSAYLFTGVGAFYYNPKGKYNGTWYALRKLHTEGQGLAGGPAQYSNFNICIPVGIGMKYVVNKKWSVGAELSVRKTFTDYIDDVSTRYYDKTALANAYGIQAAQVADPSLGEVKGATLPNADGSGAQRGDPKYKDSYMFLTINVGYKFTRSHRTRAKF